MSLFKHKRNTVFNIFLFSILGVLAYILLSNTTNLSTDAKKLNLFVWGYLFFVVSFNVLGFLIIRVSRWIGRYMMQRWKMILLYSCVAVVLLMVNYGLVVLAKILVGVSNPLAFPNGGGVILIIVWLLELIVVGLLLVNQSVLQTMHIQQETAKLKAENDKAKYGALQGQLNPHFLFNSLNTLIAEIEYDPENAMLFTRNLSDAYRYVLQCQDKELTTIANELEFMNTFIFLHRVRMGNFITVHCDIPPQYADALIPPLTLQLLMENIIKHNTISENNPMCISINICDNMLIVRNTLNAKKTIDAIGTGLKNLSSRCLLTMQKDILIQKDETTFTVQIPFIYE